MPMAPDYLALSTSEIMTLAWCQKYLMSGLMQRLGVATPGAAMASLHDTTPEDRRDTADAMILALSAAIATPAEA